MPERGSESAGAEASAGIWDARVRAARDGDREALGFVLSCVGAYLRLRAHEKLDAQIRVKVSPSDIVQETLLEAHRGFGQFRGATRGELLAWVHGILHNRVQMARRWYRGTSKRELGREVDARLSQELGDLAELALVNSTPSEHAVAAEERVRLEVAIKQLSERDEQVIRLRNELQLSFAEVGEALECSADAAQKMWSRALKRLARKLDNGGDGETRR